MLTIFFTFYSQNYDVKYSQKYDIGLWCMPQEKQYGMLILYLKVRSQMIAVL